MILGSSANEVLSSEYYLITHSPIIYFCIIFYYLDISITMHILVLFLHITWTLYWNTDSMKRFSALTRSTIFNGDSINSFKHRLYSNLSTMTQSSFFNQKSMKHVYHCLDYEFLTYIKLIVLTTGSIKCFKHWLSYEFITLTLDHAFNT